MEMLVIFSLSIYFPWDAGFANISFTRCKIMKINYRQILYSNEKWVSVSEMIQYDEVKDIEWDTKNKGWVLLLP